MTQVFGADGVSDAGDRDQGGPLRGGADARPRRPTATSGAARAGRVDKPAQAITEACRATSKKADVAPTRVLREFGIVGRRRDRRRQGARVERCSSRRTKRGRHRHSARAGLPGVIKRHHFRGGARLARLDVPPRAGLDRRLGLSVARGQGHAGRRATWATTASRCRTSKIVRVDAENNMLAGQGRGARAAQRHRADSQGSQGQAGAGAAGRDEEGEEVMQRRRRQHQQPEGRRARPARRGLRRRVRTDLLYEAVRHYQAESPRHAQDQDPRRSLRLGQEAVEAEGHRPRARRRCAHPALAPGGTVLGPQPARLQLQPSRRRCRSARCVPRWPPSCATAS